MKNNEILNSSFRDPSGSVFLNNNILYRQINKSYAVEYDLLMETGLYEELVNKKLIIKHTDLKEPPFVDEEIAYKVIQPDLVPFISYPYEWSFSMLKDAALAMLEIQKTALKFGMTTKDASAYNMQFIDAKPILIDTLSFEKYVEGKPWVAYQQFCRHFLAPLALMSYVDVNFGTFSKVHIDGIPLDLASKLLPIKTRLNSGLLLHIHLHSQSQQKHASDSIKNTVNSSNKNVYVSRAGMLGILDSLQTTIEKLNWNLPNTEWGDYYSNTNYTDNAMVEKNNQVEELILKTSPDSVWDLGANTGRFSRLASKHGILTIATDIDSVAVELNYLECRKNNEQNLLPLIQDLTNPSPDIGFSNSERDSLLNRGPANTVLALALIHHLAISNNVPFVKIAEFFKKCCKYLIIEFVPKDDSQVKILLASRKDIFDHYTIEDFKISFKKYFEILEERSIKGTSRLLFLMKKIKND